jgi:hypothetical protein
MQALEEIRTKADEIGIESYLLKPVNTSTLYDTLVDLFGVAGTGDQRGHSKKDDSHLPDVRGIRTNQQVARELLESAGAIVEMMEGNTWAESQPGVGSTFHFTATTGVWLAMTLTLTSYMGVEIIGVTAGEASQPEKTIPRAIAYRIPSAHSFLHALDDRDASR